MRTVSLAKYRKGFVAFTVYGVDTEEPAPGEAGTPPPGSARLGTQRNLHRLGSGHPGARIPRPAGRQRGLRDTEPGGKLRGTDLGHGGLRRSRLDVPARERPAGMMLMTLSPERLHFLLPLNRGAHRGSDAKERWPERAALHLEPRLASPRAQRPLHSLTVVLTVPQLSPTWSQAGSSP